MDQTYDAIVVGGRCAGASTAMLLARAGMRVLVVEAARSDTDALSTHAVMEGGVLQLHRWGLLGAVSAAAPAIIAKEFAYGGEVDTVNVRLGAKVSAFYAPRRQFLDWLLLDAARSAGAEVWNPARVTGVVTRQGRVCGVEVLRRGKRTRALAPLTVGADGRNSTVAKAVGAPIRRHGKNSGSIMYGYFPGLSTDRYHWAFRPGAAAGVVPTGGGLACVWVGAAGTLVRPSKNAFYQLLDQAAPHIAHRIGSPVGPLRGYPGQPTWLRASAGPGWALVGDAGCFKDPLTPCGITDAFRDAELLARAVINARGDRDPLRSYEETHHRLSEPLFAIADRIAGYRWSLAELRGLQQTINAMRPDVETL
ncbi:NAD(P)/FAD-dependent oxidoreductase [Mycobacterium sp. CVI_P3]|uniref:NAD(P)/FAD-dependent oxidoreductase n=1 Tax=Mycobacterium pinniadriaticum TaxID=2994102 RepID=A0ABT3SKG9_9MYCO|nr:NAD(P)/FAD-dependent oxidoreductase [Mycobacterium pinniadriaticum]MCX2933546.1 NAD(P)/FAD-dependent oxidoreductase [Mycobacterium pinniadriaticum]MCX2939953.1 NAD(P)/FAD-dependent oxidoreductase [Mycobacterium pinniadriaticum]